MTAYGRPGNRYQRLEIADPALAVHAVSVEVKVGRFDHIIGFCLLGPTLLVTLVSRARAFGNRAVVLMMADRAVGNTGSAHYRKLAIWFRDLAGRCRLHPSSLIHSPSC